MKNSSLRLGIVSSLLLLIVSCQKEVFTPEKNPGGIAPLAKKIAVERPYKDDFVTWYNFVPDISGGWTPDYGPLLAYYPGGGEGNATQLGQCKTFFNQFVPFTPPAISSVPAPVTMFYSGQLNSAGLTNIPASVSTITYDDKGNSIWFTQTSSVTTPTSATRLDFVATADIVGGSGKFEGATGAITIHGYLNPQNQQDAGFSSEGKIKY